MARDRQSTTDIASQIMEETMSDLLHSAESTMQESDIGSAAKSKALSSDINYVTAQSVESLYNHSRAVDSFNSILSTGNVNVNKTFNNMVSSLDKTARQLDNHSKRLALIHEEQSRAMGLGVETINKTTGRTIWTPNTTDAPSGMKKEGKFATELGKLGQAFSSLKDRMDFGSRSEGSLRGYMAEMNSLQREVRRKAQSAAYLTGSGSYGENGQRTSGGFGADRTPAAHNWTRQIVNTVDNVISSAMYPAIEQFIMKPMQTGMMSAEVMPGFLPQASMVQQPFQVLSSYMSQMGSDMQMIEMEKKSLTAVTGSEAASQRLVEHAIKIAKTEPVEFGTALQAFRSFSVFPGTRQEVKNSPEFRGELLDVIQRLAILTPEQGEQGATFALRELLSGQERSIQRRFNIDVETIFSAAGKPNMTRSEFRALPGDEMISVLSRAMKKITGPSALVERSLTTSIQVNDLRDSMMQAFALPLNRTGLAGMNILSKTEEANYAKDLVTRNRQMFGSSMSEEEIQIRAKKEAAIAAGSPIGGMASALRGLNATTGEALRDTGMGSVIGQSITGNIIRPFLNAMKPSKGDPMDRLIGGIDVLTRGLMKSGTEISSDSNIQRLVESLTTAAVATTTKLVAPAAMKGLTIGTSSMVNATFEPSSMKSMLSDTVFGQGGLGSTGGIASPMGGIALASWLYAGSWQSKKAIARSGFEAKYDRTAAPGERIYYNRMSTNTRVTDLKDVPLRHRIGTNMFGTDFNKGWNFPQMALGGALAAGGIRGLMQGGDVGTTTVSTLSTLAGIGMMKGLIPESSRAGYSDYKDAKKNQPLDIVPMSRKFVGALDKAADHTNKFGTKVWKVLNKDLHMPVSPKVLDSIAKRTGYDYIRGRRSGRIAGSAPDRDRGSILSNAMTHYLGPGRIGQYTGAIGRGGIGALNKGMNFAARNPLEFAGGLIAAGAIGSNWYKNSQRLDEEKKSLNTRIENTGWLSPEQREQLRGTKRWEGFFGGMSALGGLATTAGMVSMGASGGLSTSVSLTLAAVGAAMAAGGAIGQNIYGNQADKESSGLSLENKIRGNLENINTVPGDVYKEGLLANVAQAMGKPIVDKKQWERAGNLEEELLKLQQGGSYRSVDTAGQLSKVRETGWLENVNRKAVEAIGRAKDPEDIKAIGAGLTKYSQLGTELVNDKSFQAALSKGIGKGTGDNRGNKGNLFSQKISSSAQLAGSASAGLGDKSYIEGRTKNIKELKEKLNLDIDISEYDRYTQKLWKASKAAMAATQTGKNFKDVVSDQATELAKASMAQDKLQQQRMKELIPKFGAIKSSSLTKKDRLFGKYFGLDKDTDKIIKEDLAIDPMKFKNDPEGYFIKLKELAGKFNELEAERDRKIGTTGSFVSRHFKDQAGRYKTDWELKGEYAMEMQTLEAQAKMGRPGAKGMLRRTNDINKYLKEKVQSPDEGMKLVNQFESQGYIIDPVSKMRFEQGMTLQDVTHNMDTAENNLTKTNKTGLEGIFKETVIKPKIAELESQRADEIMVQQALPKSKRDNSRITQLNDQIGRAKKGQIFVPFEQLEDMDTGFTKSMYGPSNTQDAFRFYGVQAAELLDPEKLRAESATEGFFKTGNYKPMMKEFKSMRSSAADRYIKEKGVTNKDEIAKLHKTLMNDDTALQYFRDNPDDKNKAMFDAKQSIAGVGAMQVAFGRAKKAGVRGLGAMMDINLKDRDLTGYYGRFLTGKVLATDKQGQVMPNFDITADNQWMTYTDKNRRITKYPGGRIGERHYVKRRPVARAAYEQYNYGNAVLTNIGSQSTTQRIPEESGRAEAMFNRYSKPPTVTLRPRAKKKEIYQVPTVKPRARKEVIPSPLDLTRPLVELKPQGRKVITPSIDLSGKGPEWNMPSPKNDVGWDPMRHIPSPIDLSGKGEVWPGWGDIGKGPSNVIGWDPLSKIPDTGVKSEGSYGMVMLEPGSIPFKPGSKANPLTPGRENGVRTGRKGKDFEYYDDKGTLNIEMGGGFDVRPAPEANPLTPGRENGVRTENYGKPLEYYDKEGVLNIDFDNGPKVLEAPKVKVPSSTEMTPSEANMSPEDRIKKFYKERGIEDKTNPDDNAATETKEFADAVVVSTDAIQALTDAVQILIGNIDSSVV